jgi:hypothetical protein
MQQSQEEKNMRPFEEAFKDFDSCYCTDSGKLFGHNYEDMKAILKKFYDFVKVEEHIIGEFEMMWHNFGTYVDLGGFKIPLPNKFQIGMRYELILRKK